MAYDGGRQYEAPRRAYMQESQPPQSHNHGQFTPQRQLQNYPQDSYPQYNHGQQSNHAAAAGGGGGGGGGGWDPYGNNNNSNTYAGQHDEAANMNASFGNLSVQSRAPPQNNHYDGQNYSQPNNANAGGYRPPNQNPNYSRPSDQLGDPSFRNGNAPPRGPPGRSPNGPPPRGPPMAGDRPGTAGSWQGRSMPPPGQQRPQPPPSGPMNYGGPRPRNGPPNGGRGGHPPGNQFHRPRPPPEGNSYQDQFGAPNDRHGGPQDPDGHGRDGWRPYGDAGRSQTMPAHIHPGNPEYQQRSGSYGQPGSRQPDYGDAHYRPNEGYGSFDNHNPVNTDDLGRESVGDVLDLYSYDDSYNGNQHGNPQPHIPRNNPHAGNSRPPPQPYNLDRRPAPGPFGAQAHRSRSQPNLRGDGYNQGPIPNGHPESVPPMPSMQQRPTNWSSPASGAGDFNGDRSGNLPPNSRGLAGSQPGAQFEYPGPNNRPPPQRVYPNQAASNVLNSKTHPQVAGSSPAASTMATANFDDPDSLPEHPAPVRPGLSGDDSSARTGRSAAPVNPLVAEGKMSVHDVGPVTFDMLNLMRNEIASQPASQPVNPSLQFRFARRLVEASFVLVNESDGKAARRSRENFTLEAHKIVKKLTGGPHPYPEAMFYLANCYGDGSLGLEVDNDKAFNLYQSAAKLNHSPSAFRTALCCEMGSGTRKEPQKAIQWYRKAATLGDTGAMYKVGIILHKGLLGVPRNDREAVSWLRRAAAQADEENPHALHQLGIMHESADGNSSIVRDVAYAKELFTKAAELGYPPSQYRLGTAYAYGLIGCPVDAKLSITWYSRAAANGDAESELALAGWYLTGAEGVLEQNDTEAYLWSRKAAEQGNAKAEFAVGHLTELGIGLNGAGSDEEARTWYFRAAGQGHPKAKERLEEMRRGAPKKTRERLSRHNKAKDDADCVVM